MKKLKRNFIVGLMILAVAGLGPVSALAQTTTQASADSALIADLLKQIQSLQEQIRQIVSARAQNVNATSTLELKQELRRGMSGEEVRMLQRILATDRTLYPEGLVTGFFGPLTEQAVERLQTKLKLKQEGILGPETIARINEILWAAGITGDIPTDLLGSRVKIQVEIKDGKQEIKIEVKCDSSGSGNLCNDDDEKDEDEDENELEIEVEIEEGRARVDIEKDGDESRLVLNVTDRSAVVAELAKLLNLTESEINAVIQFEDEDEVEDEDDEDEEEEDDQDDEEDDD